MLSDRGSVLPKAILFDLDDTIIAFGDRRLLAMEVAQEFEAYSGDFSPEELGGIVEDAFVRFWSDEENGRNWRFRLLEARILIVTQVFESLRDRAPLLSPEVAEKFGLRFNEIRESQVRFFPGALDTLDEFKRRGVKLALVTNGHAATQRHKVDRFGLVHRFDHIQIEGEVGFGKPEERAYVHAMEALDVSAAETWMVGDNLVWEVAAPQQLGIYSIWHDHNGRGLPPGSTIKPDRIIRLISELKPID